MTGFMRKALVLCLAAIILLPVVHVRGEGDNMTVDLPHVTGTFIQPNAFTTYSVKNWEKHFDYLLEAGIDTLIIQWIAETPQGKLLHIYYPTEHKFEKNPGYVSSSRFLPNLLEAARNKNMKVYIGLNIADEWWVHTCLLEEWNQLQARIGEELARDIWEKYKADYPDTLVGWYFPWEMFNGMLGQEKKAASFLNLYLHSLTELDPSMPLMLSPFIRSIGGSPETAEAEWRKVFEYTDFRPGDIFCCQDAVGAGHITIDQLDSYFASLKRAADTKEGLLFWANSECFNSNLTPADVTRFIRQMEIASPYVSGFVTFAYSHYYSPDYTHNDTYHSQYLDYIHGQP